MATANKIIDVVEGKRRGVLTRMLPIAAALASILASMAAHAQTPPNVACAGAQQAGEGESTTRPQQAGEGESSTRPQKVGEGESSTRPQQAGEGESNTRPQKTAEAEGNPLPQKAASAKPCKA